MRTRHLLTLALIGLLAAMAAADDALVVPLRGAGPRVDGDLGETFWRESAVTGFLLHAKSGEPTPRKAIARVGATRDAVYVAFIVLGAVDGAERFRVDLYPFAAFPRQRRPRKGKAPTDPAKRLRCIIAPSGAARIVGGKGRPEAASRRLPGGSVLEVRIPLDGLGPMRPRRGDLWQANLALAGDEEALWSLDPGPAPDTRAGRWWFGERNLVPNGGFERWQGLRPKGWILETPAGEHGRRPMALREGDAVVEGKTALRAVYRKRLTLRPAEPIPLRKGAAYRLTLALWAQPAPTTKVEVELSAAPSRIRRFRPPPENVRVSMPFVARADEARLAVTVIGARGAIVLDDVVLEAILPRDLPKPKAPLTKPASPKM